jgi:hypothetical protein
MVFCLSPYFGETGVAQVVMPGNVKYRCCDAYEMMARFIYGSTIWRIPVVFYR